MPQIVRFLIVLAALLAAALLSAQAADNPALCKQAGTIVEHLPEGGEEVTVGDHKYVKIGETYYQPIQKDGKSMYEVVEVKSQ